MKVKLLDNTKLPERKRPQDAGYDFYLNSDITLKAKEISIINTGVCLELPDGYAGLFHLRSSISKFPLLIQNPLIDSNYRGELHAIIYNASSTDFKFNKGERLYSLCVYRICQEPLESVEYLSDTDRGTAWNGSSGK